MRNRLLLTGVIAAVLLAVPAQAQDAPPESSATETMNEAGRWMLQISDALEISHSEYQRTSPEMQALVANLRSPEQAKAAGAQLRQIIAPMRAAITQSNAALDRIGPAPAALDSAFGGSNLTGAKIVAEAKQQNAALDRLYKMLETMGAALSAGDGKTVMATAPRMIEGAFALIDNQAMLIRNRQLLVARDESTHQALGVTRLLYVGMSAAMRAGAAVQMNPGRAVDFAQLRDDLVKLARAADALAAEGRRNLAREQQELAQLDRAVAREGTADQKAELKRMQSIYVIEQETFAVADDLAGLLRQSATRLGQPQAGITVRSMAGPYEAIENRLSDITRRQAVAMAGAQ